MSSNSDVPLRVESSAGKTVIVFAFFFFLGLSIWFTPLPNAPEISCDRPCHELEWPRICRLKFILESHTIPERNCSTPSGQCVKEDLPYKPGEKLLTVNRQIPGPRIHVCLHDILLVDVVNRLSDTSVSVHWRGQVHRNEALMDGVPMISQCPIPSYTTFQYKFRASDPGTHIWHLHKKDNGPAHLNNLYGMLIVRESRKTEPHNEVTDYDQSEHAIILRTIGKYPQSTIFINGRYGKAKHDNSLNFQVDKNKRYRFRVAHSGGDVKCPIAGTIGDHQLLVIALDGNPIEPVYTSRIILAPGERLDFVLWTEHDIKSYPIQFSFANDCLLKGSSFAWLNYSSERQEKKMIQKKFDYKPIFSTILTDECDENVVCLEVVRSREKVPEDIARVDTTFYLFYDYQKFQVDSIDGSFEVAHINNITFVYPSSPLTSQISDVPTEIICNEDKLPDMCDKPGDDICHCTHVIDINQGSVVEVILVHREYAPKRDHIFHLHGHKFRVLGRRKLDTFYTIEDIKKADATGKLISRNLENSVKKDTLVIPAGGVAVIRFLADNPGFWLLQEEGGSHGMEVVFNVIGSQHNVPESFPRCGNWIGPKYFFA